MKLSKSLYTRAIQCPKSLWLKKYSPEVLTPPDASAKAHFETGNIVGDLACQLFPGGKEVAFTPESFEAMAEQTLQWIAEKRKKGSVATLKLHKLFKVFLHNFLYFRF